MSGSGKTAGIVCEYNPFHYGHKYQIIETINRGLFENIVCVMSGNFVQRGEPAIVRKHVRAECAIRNGADLVIELPFVYSNSSAEFFASGALGIMTSCGIIDALSFGCETDDIQVLSDIAGILVDEPAWYKTALKAYLSKGLSFPKARQMAVKSKYPGISDVLSWPNNILSVEYLKAIYRTGSKIKPITVKRKVSDYNEPETVGMFSSATSIRKFILDNIKNRVEVGRVGSGREEVSCGKTDRVEVSWEGPSWEGPGWEGPGWEGLKLFMPDNCSDLLVNEFKEGRGPVFFEDFEQLVLSLFRIVPTDFVASLPFVTEGLENRLIDAARNSGSIDEMIRQVGTTRYPDARIRRILISLITGLNKTFPETQNADNPLYYRILAFNDKGKKLIKKMADSGKHIITGGLGSKIYELRGATADIKFDNNNKNDEAYNNTLNLIEQLLLECKASDIYVLGYRERSERKAGMDNLPAVYIKD